MLVDLIDAPNVIVGDFLNLILALERLVFGDVPVFFHGFEHVVGVPPDVPDGDFIILAYFADDLDQFLPALFRQGRDGDPDDLPVIARGQSEIGFQNGLF